MLKILFSFIFTNFQTVTQAVFLHYKTAKYERHDYSPYL